MLTLLVMVTVSMGLLIRAHAVARRQVAEMSLQVAQLDEAKVTSERVTLLLQDMERLKGRLSDVGKKAGQIETMIGLDGELAVGGSDPGGRSSAFSRSYKGKQQELLTELADELGMLDATLDDEASRADFLLSYLDKHKKLLRSIPSITPIEGGWLSSAYGMRRDPFTHKKAFHGGVDLASPTGTPIVAAADGVVKQVKWCSGWGRTAEIDHGNGFTTWYAHCSKVLVERGDFVERGDTIALVGSTGRSTGPHLHYEVRINGKSQNPIYYMLDRD